jgi:peroxiredoxin
MSDSKPPVPIGGDAPDFTVKDLQGKSYTLSSLRGRPVMIDFWATWCPPCRKGLPETEETYRKYGAQSLAVMTISNEDVATIGAFVKKNHYTFPTYRDPNDDASKAYNVTGIPTLVIIDATGKLVAYYVGLQDPEAIQGALKKAGVE